MKIIKKKLSELKPAEWNPRSIPDEALKGLEESINRFGLVEPIVWNKRTGNVVGGHQRLKVLERQGVKSTDVVVVDIPESDEKALNVTLNNPHITGQFTMPDDYLALRLDELEISKPKQGETDPDQIPEQVDPICERGQIWSLGRHRVMCGDSTDAADVALLMDGNKASCMWTDPPYGVDYTGKTKDALKIQGDKTDFKEIVSGAFEAADTILSEGSGIYVAHPPGVLSMDFCKIFVDQGWHFHETLVWVKHSMVLGHSDYHYKHEPILYGWRGVNRGWYGGRDQVSVFEVDRPMASKEHPTMKPVDLITPMIRNSSVAGQVVYDPFLGFGSTLIACEQLDRICYGMEIDPHYCDVIIKRWEDFTGGKAELVI